MELTPGQHLHGFTVKTREDLPEIDGEAYTLIHDKSGARLLYLKNDDMDKSFSIAFRTVPADDTGVFHILEHSVLCGSRKFPVKEPFVNLLKTSMQTFLNAMTFPDKTMYPVASTNDQDLLNLTDVYLDAVLHPNIYRKRTIFEQEGWHYELEPADEEDAAAGDEGGAPRLVYNGVVFNEMKGALSDPDSVLIDELQAALFPDTAYRFESGGTPRAIPTLTYEHYLEEHTRHYRLDNSYITLYGDLDADAMLAFLDTRYLSPVADEQAATAEMRPRELTLQEPVKALGVQRPMVTAPENSCMALGYVIGQASDRRRLVAVDILLDAVAGSNEAPLRRALLDAGLADDPCAYVGDGVLQPFAVIELRGLAEYAREGFRATVEGTLRKLAEGGLDHELVKAALSHAEFVTRERDFGMSDGVALSMSALSGWLYDDDMPTTYLRYEDDFAFLREALDTDYFEKLIREVFLENDHMAEVEIVPVEALDEDDEDARLDAIAAQMTEDDFSHVAAEEAELRRMQTEPDAPEDVATLPALGLADIGQAPAEPAFELVAGTPVPCLHHRIPTRGIVYTYRYFDLSRIAYDDLPYVRILSRVLGKLPTEHYSASELDTVVNGRLGSLAFFAEVYGDETDAASLAPKFVVGSSALSENLDDLNDLPREIMLTTDFSDAGKIKDVLQQMRVGMEQGFATEGHSYAMARVASYVLPSGVLNSQLSGVDFYRFLKRLLANFDEQADALSAKLADVARRLFVDDGLTVSFTGSDADFERFGARGAGAVERRGDGAGSLLVLPAPVVRNEAFIVPADVCFAAQGADRRAHEASYSGQWLVAGRVLSYDYLWNEVRVKGGAYGTGFQAPRTGAMRFYSYRDPHLDETLARFAAAPDWLRAFDPDPSEMEGYIVSSVAGFDKPQKPRALARRQDAQHFHGHTREDRLQTRAEMLEATPSSLAARADVIEAVLDERAICVFGNRDILESSRAGLNVIDLLNE